MAKKGLVKTNVKPMTVVFLLVGIAIVLLINVLARFNIFDFTPFTADVITIITSIALLIEVSAFAMLRNFRSRARQGGKFVFDLIIGIIALIALIAAGLGLAGVSVAALETFKGIVDSGLIIFAIVEIFR